MPRIDLGSFVCHYRLDGPDDAPVLVLAHALGLDQGMWDWQARALEPHLRVLRYDTRGHGASSAPSGDYTVEALADDVLALADALGIQTFAFCGLSLGGMVGQRLALRAPDRLTHLVLASTSPRVSDPAAMETRRQTVLAQGMRAVTDLALERFFSAAFRARGSSAVAWARRTLLATDPQGYASACAAVRDHDTRGAVAGIRIPTLVVGGDRDVSMPWDVHGAQLAEAIPAARTARLSAAHISNIEAPSAFTAALASFLLPAAADTREAGLRTRRLVLGDAHVDRAMASATPLTQAFQALITDYAWGTIWSRPGLDVRTRRLLVLAVTAALGRWEEFRLHLRAGIVGGLEWNDVEEVLLQVAVYAGVPAANTAFQIAAEEQASRPGD